MRWLICVSIYLLLTNLAVADCCCDLQLPSNWKTLKPILNARLRDPNPALKLDDQQVDAIIDYIEAHNNSYPELQKLQLHMPNCCLELLRLLQQKTISAATMQQQVTRLNNAMKGKTDAEIVSLDSKMAVGFANQK